MTPAERERLETDIDRASNARDWRSVTALLARAIEQDPFDGQWWFRLALMHTNQGELRRAVEAYERQLACHEIARQFYSATQAAQQMEQAAREHERDARVSGGDARRAAVLALGEAWWALGRPAQREKVLRERHKDSTHELFADVDDDAWAASRRAFARECPATRVTVVMRGRRCELDELPRGHRTTALACARRVFANQGREVELDVDAAAESVPMSRGPFHWASLAGAAPTAPVVPRGAGRFSVERSPEEALRCLVADAMPQPPLDPWLLLRVYVWLGGKARLEDVEPPHLEDGAAVLEVMCTHVTAAAEQRCRLRVDPHTLGVDVAPH